MLPYALVQKLSNAVYVVCWVGNCRDFCQLTSRGHTLYTDTVFRCGNSELRVALIRLESPEQARLRKEEAAKKVEHFVKISFLRPTHAFKGVAEIARQYRDNVPVSL